MTGYVQLRGFRVSADHTAVAETTMKSSKEGDSVFEGRFRATRVVSLFYAFYFIVITIVRDLI